MKQMIIKIGIIILLATVFMPNKVLANSSSSGYTIEAYNIDMQVNEDNTFDITETIIANFTGYNKHGIYRKIPLKNSVTRTDGTKSNNNAKITNISVNDNFKTSNESGYKVIKIGDADKTVSGIKTYTVKYTYNIGKDPLKNADELYFNLIGDEWDTSISYVTFKITMPKEFNKTLLGFSSGKTGSTNSSNVLYNVNGNVISGSLRNSLSSGEALTVRLTLPEGYFVGASLNLNMYAIITIIISLLFVLISYKLWAKHGKDDKVIETVEFYPPKGFNSAEVGYLYEGVADDNSIISLLIYLANKGYLKIEEIEKKALIGKYKSFKIIKLKEYDGNNENERIFFDGLFECKKIGKLIDASKVILNDIEAFLEKNKKMENFKDDDTVTEDDLHDNFYRILDIIKSRLDSKENKNKIFEATASKKRKWLILMIIGIFLLITIKPTLEYSNQTVYINGIPTDSPIAMIPFTLLFPGIGFSLLFVLMYQKSIIHKICGLVIGGFWSGISFGMVMLPILIQDISYFIMYIIGIICVAIIILFVKIMPKRTHYGNEMLGKIQGFKNFLEIVEKPKLEQLVMEDPEYFYNILPYTYALGVSDIWVKQFETMAIQAPNWYDSTGDFNMKTFGTFMATTMVAVSASMSSSPSSNSSGGGSSGGGSGGGGGGSW